MISHFRQAAKNSPEHRVSRTTCSRGKPSALVALVGLEDQVALLARADAVRGLNWENEDLAVANIAGAGVLEHGVDHYLHVFVLNDDGPRARQVHHDRAATRLRRPQGHEVGENRHAAANS